MLDILFDWSELLSIGVDAAVYMVMAVVATLLFMFRLALAMYGGDGSDDLAGDSDASFTLFSFLSVLAFFMGAGWMGLACRIDWEMGSVQSAFFAGGFGLVLMMAASGLTTLTRRLNEEARYDATTAIGMTGRVYLPIPQKGEGHGQVQVTVSGRRKTMSAVSAGPALEAFADVIVRGVEDDETLVVEAKYPKSPTHPNE